MEADERALLGERLGAAVDRARVLVERCQANREAGDSLRDDLAVMRAAVPPPPLLTIEHAAQWLDVSIKTIRRLVERHELRTVRIGPSQIRVRLDDLASLIESHTEREVG